jgi:uncharacterized protein YecE (DUF72 family)
MGRVRVGTSGWLYRSWRGRFYPKDEEITSDLVYARLHGSESLYTGSYSNDALDGWATKIRRWSRDRDVRVYFDNDTNADAPFDAVRLRQRLG